MIQFDRVESNEKSVVSVSIAVDTNAIKEHLSLEQGKAVFDGVAEVARAIATSPIFDELLYPKSARKTKKHIRGEIAVTDTLSVFVDALK